MMVSMNLLAHALLAYSTLPDESGETCTGAVMADYFTGQRLEDYPPGIRIGIRQHRAIDTFTDQHPRFASSRRAIADAGAPAHTAGILADVFFDHVLASEWGRWGKPLCTLELEPFGERLCSIFDGTKAWHSPIFAQVCPWISRMSWFSGWAHREGIERTLSGLSHHMSGTVDLAKSITILDRLDTTIRLDFAAFWPDLVGFARHWAEQES